MEKNTAFYLREETVVMYQLVFFMPTTVFFDTRPWEWSPKFGASPMKEK